MAYAVYITDDAARDLEDLYAFLRQHTVDGRAEYVLAQIEAAFKSLNEQPERGSYPKELLVVGNRDFREIFFKPYRIVYRIIGGNVYVFLIADGRRDMQALLQQRLLKS